MTSVYVVRKVFEYSHTHFYWLAIAGVYCVCLKEREKENTENVN